MDFIRLLPALEANIRVHGNGFLQAQTYLGDKIHIWDPRLPRQKVPTKIHNHNHGFISTILEGTLELSEFYLCGGIDLVPHMCVPRSGKDTELGVSGLSTGIKLHRSFRLREGSMYQFPHDMDLFHEVTPITDVVITHVQSTERLDEEDNLPTVLVPTGKKPDNDFNRYAFQEIAEEVYTEHAKRLHGLNDEEIL